MARIIVGATGFCVGCPEFNICDHKVPHSEPSVNGVIYKPLITRLHECKAKREIKERIDKMEGRTPNTEIKEELTVYERHAEILEDIHNTYIQKNIAYGNSFDKSCDDFGITAAMVRMEDKWNRLKNLVKNPDINKGNEAIEDTLLDLSNYCIMTKMWLERNNNESNKPDCENF